MYFFAAIALLAGCSKEVPQTQQPDPDAWMFDVSLPVPVRFHSGDAASKAAIEKATQMVGKRFAFFAVNKNATDPNDKEINFPNNVKAKCAAIDGNDSQVRFDFEDAYGNLTSYYYPMQSEECYSFYSYYCSEAANTPAQSWPEPTITDTSITVDIKVAVTEDILWGKAVAEKVDSHDGYNARYIRKVDNSTPSITFEHPAACIEFAVTRKESVSGDGATGLTLNAANLMNIANKATLCIVDTDTATDYSGCFTGVVSKGRVSVLPAPQQLLTTSSYELPDLFIMPQNEPLTLKLDFTVEGSSSILSQEYPIDPADYNLTNGFERGKRYRFNLIVYSPVKVDIVAEVLPYEDAFGEGVVEEYDPDAID